ncbi:immunity 53 family protein [Actinomycetes bacterium NPDC127524]
MSVLKWIEQWYFDQCDGDWEHRKGIEIHTLDNPGWYVTINLLGTNLEEKSMEKVEIERNDNDWLHCWIKDNSDEYEFHAAGGAKNLEEILNFFKDWALN